MDRLTAELNNYIRALENYECGDDEIWEIIRLLPREFIVCHLGRSDANIIPLMQPDGWQNNNGRAFRECLCAARLPFPITRQLLYEAAKFIRSRAAAISATSN